MLHHNRSSQKHINQYTKFIKNIITKHELKRRPMNLLPRQNAGKSESTDKMVETWPYYKKKTWLEKKKRRKYYEHTLILVSRKPVMYLV